MASGKFSQQLKNCYSSYSGYTPSNLTKAVGWLASFRHAEIQCIEKAVYIAIL